MFHQNILEQSTETEDGLRVGRHLVKSEPEPPRGKRQHYGAKGVDLAVEN